MIKTIFNFIINETIWRLISVYQLIIETLALWSIRCSKNGGVDNSCTNKVSIIIATYNRSEILTKRTIPSILSQSYRNFEVIVVGDCCSDDTDQKMNEINDSRVFYYNLGKRGSYPDSPKVRWFVQGGVPRNFGMKIATGDWFVFISDDDILYENHLETLLSHAVSKNLEFVSAAYDAFVDGQVKTIYPAKNNHESELICGGMQSWIYRSYLKSFRWNIQSWRKPFDRPIDYDLQQRFYRCGVRMGHIKDVVFYSPEVGDSGTSGYRAVLRS